VSIRGWELKNLLFHPLTDPPTHPFTIHQELFMSPESSLNLQDGRFQKGRSGNPKGKPKGTRNRTTIISQNLLEGEAEALVRKVVQLALEGDLTCLRICLERLVPPKKEAPIEIDLPEIGAIADMPKFFTALMAKLGEGITPSEARTVIDLAEVVCKSLGMKELEERIGALEEKAIAMGRF
jgi:hypothetical protein